MPSYDTILSTAVLTTVALITTASLKFVASLFKKHPGTAFSLLLNTLQLLLCSSVAYQLLRHTEPVTPAGVLKISAIVYLFFNGFEGFLRVLGEFISSAHPHQ